MTSEEFRITKLEQLRQANMKRYDFGTSIMRNIRICAECGLPSPASAKTCSACGVK